MENKIKKAFREILIVIFGSAVGSFAIVAIMIPNGLTYGGVTGISRIVQSYTGKNYSLIYYAFSMIIVIIVWLTLGFKEVRKILAVSIVYPTIMFIFETLNLKLLESKDMFLSAIFCGVLFGISNGIIFYGGYSSGGTDSLAKVIRIKIFPYMGLSRILFIIDFFIIIISAIVFGRNIALYALITMYVAMKMTDAVLYGITAKVVEMSIITTATKELTEYVIKDIGRGVTSIDIIGEYTGEHKKQLKILCSPRESFLIKRFLVKHDPKSFVSILMVNSVWGVGRGFADINDLEN